MITKGSVYRGRIATDILVYVKAVSKKTNTVVGKVKMGMNGIADDTISYRYDTFLEYYEETDIVYTRVSFKLHDDDVIAFLWDVPANNSMVMSYMHVGQHGEASKAFFDECKYATLPVYSSLKQELESIGYLLNVVEVDSMPREFKAGYI